MEELVTAKEYAKMIGTSVRIVQRLCDQERIPGAKKYGRDWLIPADARPIPGKKGPRAEWERNLAKLQD